jgi:hypothetical protein
VAPTGGPTGLAVLDSLQYVEPVTVQEYVNAASEYVLRSSTLTDGQKKAAQIRLSNVLGRALKNDLQARNPRIHNLHVGETVVSGALRTAKADLVESNLLDGLRLAVEIKPVNLAVGRAIWNRFGDIRTFAVNIHLKFPFAVVAGVLTIPTFEIASGSVRKDTKHLIRRAVQRLTRAGGRRTEGDAPHLLEGIGVLVYDPDSATISEELPPRDSGLRWEEFITLLATSYDARFEETRPSPEGD